MEQSICSPPMLSLSHEQLQTLHSQLSNKNVAVVFDALAGKPITDPVPKYVSGAAHGGALCLTCTEVLEENMFSA